MERNIFSGILILLILGLVIVIIVFAPNIMSKADTSCTIQFNSAAGLRAGDSVYLQGVTVGEVRKVQFANNNVEARISIYRQYVNDIPGDSFFYIWWDKVVTGKKCIRIARGSRGSSIEAGQRITGEANVLKIMLQLGAKLFEDGFEDTRNMSN